MSLPIRSVALVAMSLLCVIPAFASDAGKAPPQGSALLSAEVESLPDVSQAPPPSPFPSEVVVIPGPLRPLLRMAGISQEVSPAEVLPLLARNVSLWGYENDKPTEYLLLVDRYVRLAKELRALASSDGIIRVAGCDDASRLIQVLGYQFQHGCGSTGASLTTADAERAFLTIDSGFPITVLEENLQKGTPFAYSFPGTPVPVLFTEKSWTAISPLRKKHGDDFLQILLHDRNVDRLYSALARTDKQTAAGLMRSPGLYRLLASAGVLDFYGSRISIRNGMVAVPGGPAAEDAWRELADASPRSPGEFVSHLLTRDHGWLAAYFDAIARIGSAQQAHFTDVTRLKDVYEAYKSGSKNFQNNAADGVFARNAGLLLLLTRLQWQADGQPTVPGSIAVWRDILNRKSNTVAVKGKPAGQRPVDNPDQLLDSLAASSIIENGPGPLQIYLATSAIDAGRPADRKLSEATVRVLADRFLEFNSWYPIFAEFPSLDDSAIAAFVDAADRINKISDSSLRSNALGSFQAEVGLWQILARQGQIPDQALNPSWQNAIKPWAAISSNIQLFDSARTSLQSIMVAASGDAHLTQDQFIDLLAGPPQDTADGRRAHQDLARRIRSVIQDQHLVSVDSLAGLFDGLEELSHADKTHSSPLTDNLILLASDLREFELPRPIFSGSEKTSWAPIVYTTRHVELQVRTDLTAILRNPTSSAQLENARGRLAPFLRDTLVGLNYAYYEPPGAQVLHNNPLFVRSHDFTASSVQGIEHVWGKPELVGVGVTAGGGAYLLGSLADLPFALANVEQDFISPTKVQALIWKEIVPAFLVNAVLPRWWGIHPEEMHAAALYQRTGEELLIASATNSQLREQVLGLLADRMAPARLELIAQSLDGEQTAKALIPQVLPADSFFLAADFRARYPQQSAHYGAAGRELDEIARKDPAHTNLARLSKVFGLPHLEIAQSDACTLLNLGIFPASGAFDGRLFGESWESSNLYWARLADETGYSPAMLNILVPNLTRRMVANIFATNIDDWPALLRAMERTGDEFRQAKLNGHSTGTTTGQVVPYPVATVQTADARQSVQEVQSR